MKKYLLFIYLLNVCQAQAWDNLQEKIVIYLQDAFDHSIAPGFAVVIVKKDHVIFKKAYGVERAGSSTPMTTRTSSAIGSLTKSFTAMAMMQLVEQGWVELDRPIIQYLPNFRTANSNISDQITVRMLLNNTSGIYGDIPALQHFDGQSVSNILEYYESLFIKKQPGESYEYSNAGFALAGALISHISGRSFADYVQTNIFEPLRMYQSAVDPSRFKKKNLAYGHNFGIHEGIPAHPPIYSLEMMPAGSTMRCSIEDLGHYLRTLLAANASDEEALIGKKSMQEMWSPNIGFQGLPCDDGGDGQEYHYGLGWMMSNIDGRDIVHHGGSTGTMSSFTMIDPGQDIAAAIILNIDYNFIDKFQYQSEVSILNNLLHLIADEPLSDYGNKRIDDPTINEFHLSKHDMGKYVGSYKLQAGGDNWFLYGANLEISLSEFDELSGSVRRGPEILMHFVFDFIHPSLAVNRNIGIPQQIQFQISGQGEVNCLFLGGAKFVKVPPTFYLRNREISYQDYRFWLPDDWTVLIQDKFRSTWGNKHGEEVTVVQTGNISEIMEYCYPTLEILDRGSTFREREGSYLWEEQSLIAKDKTQHYQLVIMKDISERTSISLLYAAPREKFDLRKMQLIINSFE